MKNKDLFCLIGYPVSHSLSPKMHNSAFKNAGINAVYTVLAVRPVNLENSISTLKKLGVMGINVTMPLKEKVINFIDTIDHSAEKIGAVNTIVNDNGELKGYNTDSSGGVEAVKEVLGSLNGRKAVILGKGGMGRSIAFGLKSNGMRVLMLGRDEMGEKDLSSALLDADIVCNCTPVGMKDESTPVPRELLRVDLAVLDSVYKNGETRLIRDAKAKGSKIIDGRQILINQGVISFKLWTGMEPDRDIMWKSITDGLNENGILEEQNIYLTGFMGSGKSTVGKIAAERLGKKFIDIDQRISSAYGQSIKDIFSKDGEEKFRCIEKSEIESVSMEAGAIISLGGGSILDFDNVALIKGSGKVILLRTEAATIFQRLEGSGSRPLLTGKGEKVELDKIRMELDRRAPYYELSKDIEISTDGKDEKGVAEEIIRKLGDFE